MDYGFIVKSIISAVGSHVTLSGQPKSFWLHAYPVFTCVSKNKKQIQYLRYFILALNDPHLIMLI